MMKIKTANWPAPSRIKAITTTRQGGFSHSPFEHFNLGLHVGDKSEDVEKNRLLLTSELQLPAPPLWLNQTHSNHCIIAGKDDERNADAAISHSADYPLVVMTADCLPIALCNQQGTEIAIVHAGWKGLLNGIIENTLTKVDSKSSSLMAWIGPAICQQCFEVGDEVYQTFMQNYPFLKTAFQPHHEKWQANLPLMAELILNNLGVHSVYQSNACTFELKNEYYSYRREQQTGRIATLIWFT